MTEIENIFSVLGGRFITPIQEIQNKLKNIKAFVFDWDGVFNNGQKNSTGGSAFSEVDSMGTNMLRFSWFLQHGALPYTAVLSGEHNDTAFYFSKRENFTASFFKVPHKMLALNAICEQQNIQPPEIAYFFDDVLDVPLAEVCGIRILVNQKANPLFINYCKKNNLVDYLTASPGGQLAVRESAELLMGLYGNFDEVVKGRKDNSEVYREYIQQRKAVSPDFFTAGQNGIEKVVM